MVSLDDFAAITALADTLYRRADYPEGHADIADDVLERALRDKQRYATAMTTQMCFNPGAVARWLARMRAAGITLPLHLGVPGVAEIAKLMTISARMIANSAGI